MHSGEILAVYKKFSIGNTRCNLIRSTVGNREAPAELIRTAVLLTSDYKFSQNFSTFMSGVKTP